MIHKKVKVLLGTMALTTMVYAQQPPQGTPGPGAFWRQGGNIGGLGAPNIFGTATNNNNPIYTVTNGVTRTRLNGDFTTTINNVAQNVSGFFGIAPNGFFNTNSPWSMLHLDGGDNSGFGGAGWRLWMRTGVFMKENSDAMYVGLKQEAGTNRSDAIINWSDDASGAGGVDKLRFLFTATANGNGSGTSPLNGSSLNGYEFMRMQTIPNITNSAGFQIGHVGIGPLFTNALTPQSRLHLNSEDNLATFVQVTTQTGTNSTVNDGLRLGVDQQFGTTNGYLRWQENTPLIIQTDWDGVAGGINNGERMRISSIGAPGVAAPAGAPNNNITRVAISHAGDQPITNPRSLLHLGYNTSNSPLGGQLNDGWRNWMDVGTFTNNGSDNMYVGLKHEGTDRDDAVVSWGDNQVPGTSPNGPDNLRFIFTSTTTALPPGQGDPVSQSNDGLEVARMIPGLATTLPNTNYGMVGIGNFYGANPPVDAKLDIDGDLRIRQVTQNDNLTQVLVIDPNDLNRVHWKNIQSTGVGNYCGATANPLTDNYEVPLNGFNYHFTGQGGNGVNNVAIGWPCGGLPGFTPPQAKLDVLEQGYVQTFGSATSIAGRFWSAPSGVTTSYGVVAIAQGGYANIGILSQAGPISGTNPPTGPNYAGYFNGDVLVTGTAAVLSDQNLKENIGSLTGGLNIIRQLKPKQFEYVSTHPELGLPGGLQYGLIAQEVEQILPELITENQLSQVDSTGDISTSTVSYKGLEYKQIIPFLIAGMQEQQTQLDAAENYSDSLENVVTDLNNRLTQLENCLSGILPFLCQLNNSAIAPTQEDVQRELAKAIDVQLSDKNNIILNQNVPNPFAEKTVISYSIPETVGKAQIHFYDGKGTLINTVDIVERGSGEINVYANDLSSGVYTYSLVADGQIVSTKRMMKQ